MSSSKQAVLDEIGYLRELQQCNNIVQIRSLHLFKDSLGVTSISLVMKYAEQGSLSKFSFDGSGSLDEESIRTIMAQLLLAMDLMHRKEIIHRDLKPDNILIMDKEDLMVCISDLGMACRANDLSLISQRCGTPSYVAPEVLNG